MSSHDGAGGGVGLWDKKVVLLLLFLAGGLLVFPFPVSFAGLVSALDARGCDKVGLVGGLGIGVV